MLHYNSLSTILIILFVVHFQQLHSLRCKCNTNRGLSPCTSGFCDIHNRDGKRAACGALRHSGQTIFACVLIRHSSNDTFCHVVGSTTACWCRQMDFCNADLEADLFDVDESTADDSKDNDDDDDDNDDDKVLSSPSHFSSNSKQNKFINESNPQLTSIQSKPLITRITVQPFINSIQSTTSSNIKQLIKTRINSAVPIDVIETIKLTPKREDLPTEIAEIIPDIYEDLLDEDDDGFHWQAIVIPNNPTTKITIPSNKSHSTYSSKLEINKPVNDAMIIGTVPVNATLITKIIPQTTVAVPIGVIPINESKRKIVSVSDTKVISEKVTGQIITSTEAVPKMLPVNNTLSHHSVTPMTPTSNNFPKTNLKPIINSEDHKESSTTKLIINSLLRPIISLTTTTTTMISLPQTSVDVKTTEKTSIKSNLQTEKKTQREKDDKLQVEPDYIRLKVTTPNIPSITYNQTALKTRLDRWKWEMIQQQQLQSINDTLINNNDNNHKDQNNIVSSTNKLPSSLIFPILLFSLLPSLLSL